MAVSLTAASLSELAKPRPRFIRSAEVIKNYYGTPVVYTITDRVSRWGVYQNSSTAYAPDWEFPSLTMTVVNGDNYFSEVSSSSLWSGAGPPRTCILRVRLYVVSDAASELVLEYLGRIESVDPVSDEEGEYAEIVTVFEPANKLSALMTRRSGSWSYLDWSALVTYWTNKGGTIIPAPVVVNMPTHYTSTTPWSYWLMTINDLCNAAEIVYKWLVTYAGWAAGHEEQWATWLNSEKMVNPAADGAIDFRIRGGSVYNDYMDIYFYNPIAWHDAVPTRAMHDQLLHAAGVDSGLVNVTSFTDLDTYFSSQTPPYVIIPVLFDMTYADGFLNLLSYAPELMVWFTYNSKIKCGKLGLLSAASSPFSFNKTAGNYRTVSGGTYSERLVTSCEFELSAYVEDGIATAESSWKVMRDLQYGGEARAVSAARYAGQPYKLAFQHRASTTRARQARKRTYSDYGFSITGGEQHYTLERPWFSIDVTNLDGVVSRYARNMFRIWRNATPTVKVVSDHRALTVENRDVIEVNVPDRGYSAKRYVVVSNSFDLDSFERTVEGYEIEFD